MATCKDCIHFKICNDYAYLIGREDKVDCPDFKSTEDVVPRAEVEKAKQEVAINIFKDIDNTIYADTDFFKMLRKKYIGE